MNDKVVKPLDEGEVYIRLFGTFEVENNAGRVSETKNSARPWLLLKYLLVNQGREIGVEEIAENVYLDQDLNKAENSTRVRLTRIRSYLDPIGLGGKHGLVIHHRMNFMINPDYDVRTDVDEFTELLAEIRRCPLEDTWGLTLSKRALELYRGRYLQYTKKDYWFETIQESYNNDFCSLAFNVLDRINATGNCEMLSFLSQRTLVFAGPNLELHRAVLGCLSRFSGEAARMRYASQVMRSVHAVDWLSTL